MGHKYTSIILSIIVLGIGFHNLFDMYSSVKRSQRQRGNYSNTSIAMLEERLEAGARDEEEEIKELAALSQSMHCAKLGN